MGEPDVVFAPVIESITTERPLAATLDTVAATVAHLAGFDFCAVLVREPGSGRIRIGGAADLPEHYAAQLDEVFDRPLDDLAFASSPTVRALHSGRAVVLEDALAEPWYEHWRHLAVRFGWRSLVSVPMVDRGRVVGVVNGYCVAPRTYPPAQLRAVDVVAQHATLALRLSVLVESRRATIEELRVSNAALAEQSRVLEQAHRIHVTLNDAVLAGADEGAVARLVCELVGLPITVGSADGRPPVRATPIGADRQACGPAGGGLRREVRIGQEVVGHIHVEVAEEAADPLVVRAVENAATVLAVHEARVRAERATEERLESDFVHDVVHGRGSAERLRERARRYGVEVGRPHRVVVVTLAAPLDGSGSWDVVRTAASVLSQRFPGVGTSRTGDGFTALVPVDDRADDGGRAALHDALADLRRSAPVVRSGAVVTCGIGSPVPWEELPASFRDATRCVQALVRLGRPGGDLVVDDLGLLGLFLDSGRAEEILAFGRTLLAPLLADTPSSRQLRTTLHSYLDHGCRLGTTAAALFVHQNTVKYRLRQIEERCGVDLHDPYDIARITIARLSLQLVPEPAGAAGAPRPAPPTG